MVNTWFMNFYFDDDVETIGELFHIRIICCINEEIQDKGKS